jgi:hypothetical protein
VLASGFLQKDSIFYNISSYVVGCPKRLNEGFPYVRALPRKKEHNTKAWQCEPGRLYFNDNSIGFLPALLNKNIQLQSELGGAIAKL